MSAARKRKSADTLSMADLRQRLRCRTAISGVIEAMYAARGKDLEHMAETLEATARIPDINRRSHA